MVKMKRVRGMAGDWDNIGGVQERRVDDEENKYERGYEEKSTR